MSLRVIAGLLSFGVVLAVAPVARAEAQAPASRPAGTHRFVLPVRETDHAKCKNLMQSLLQREVARQAVLIAARDGLGLATSDEALGDTTAPGAQGRFDLELSNPQPDQLVVELYHERDGGRERIWTTTVVGQFQAWTKEQNMLTTQAMEKASRTDLPAALKARGLATEAVKPAGDTPIPPEIETALTDLSLIAQIDAVRSLHQLIREHGESPALLAGLVRGYAQLGMLTEHFWNATPQVYSARAMLYAHRLIAIGEAPVESLRWRAFAYALTGRHDYALETLAQADKFPADPSPAPSWLAVIEAYLHFDTERLRALGREEGKERHLATLLAFVTADQLGIGAYALEIAEEALAANSECFRVLDGTYRHSDESLQEESTTFGLYVIPVLLEQRWSTLKLPEKARGVVKNTRAWQRQDTPARIAAALDAAAPDDTSEPSPAALAQIIREVQIHAVYRRAILMRKKWRVENEEFVRDSMPLVAGHPYAPLIETLAMDKNRDVEGIIKKIESMPIKDVSLHGMRWLAKDVPWDQLPADSKLQRAWRLTWQSVDATACGIKSRVEQYGDSHVRKLATAEWLGWISPHHPLPLATLVEHWDKAQPLLAEIEEAAKTQPLIQYELAKHYFDTREFAMAQRYLSVLLERCPDMWAYNSLATCFLEQGDEEAWLRTLEQVLATEDRASMHAAMRYTIIQHFMKTGRYERALPYALNDAEIGGSATIRASACYEGLGDWANAEQWIRETSERSRASVEQWYLWCRRTGRGNLEGARDLWLRALEAVPAGQRSHEDLLHWAAFHMIEAKPKEAMEMCQTNFAKSGDPYMGLHVALLAHDLGDSKLRDIALAATVERGATYEHFDSENGGGIRTELLALAKLFQETLAAGPEAKLDPTEVDRVITSGREWWKLNLYYFAGRFFAQRGDQKTAARYYRHCVTLPPITEWTQVFAYQELRKRDIEPLDVQRELIRQAAAAAPATTQKATSAPAAPFR